MSITWNDSVPIYRQLRERVVAMILDGALNEGDPLPSVRQVAADFQINPLTVSKAYQELVDDQLVEKRRGLGMSSMEPVRRCSSPSASASCERNGLHCLHGCSAWAWTLKP
jgi:GntR family transcriptional regulator